METIQNNICMFDAILRFFGFKYWGCRWKMVGPRLTNIYRVEPEFADAKYIQRCTNCGRLRAFDG